MKGANSTLLHLPDLDVPKTLAETWYQMTSLSNRFWTIPMFQSNMIIVDLVSTQPAHFKFTRKVAYCEGRFTTAGESCVSAEDYWLLGGCLRYPQLPWPKLIPGTKRLQRAFCWNRWLPVSAWWLGRFDDSLTERRGGQTEEIRSVSTHLGRSQWGSYSAFKGLGTFLMHQNTVKI